MKSGLKSAKLGVIQRCKSGICRPTFNLLDYDSPMPMDYDSLCNGVEVVKECYTLKSCLSAFGTDV